MSFLLRFAGVIAGCLVAILAWVFLPDQLAGRNAELLSDFMKTYVTIASILIGFSAGITNNFITGTNEKMMHIIRKHNFFKALLRQFHASTICNFVGLVLGLFLILALEYFPERKFVWWFSWATLSVASAGVAVFLAAASTSAMIAEKTDELYGDE